MRLLLIPPRDLSMYLGNEKIGLVDLRDKEDYYESHIKNAINIPYDEIENCYDELRKFRMIIFYCSRGNQSLLVARSMSLSGFLTGSVAGGYKAYTIEMCQRNSFD